MTPAKNSTPVCFSCLRPEDVRTNLTAADKYTAIRMAGQQLVSRGCVEEDYIDAMLARLQSLSDDHFNAHPDEINGATSAPSNTTRV